MSRKTYLDLAVDDPMIPTAGDILRSKRVEYRVTEVWPTESKVWPNRWTLTLGDGHDPKTLEPDGGRVIRTVTYRRGEGPHDFFGQP